MLIIIYLEEAVDFIDKMPENARLKLLYNIELVRNGVKEERIFKKLESTNIWEFRCEYNSQSYRLLSFWDKRQNSLIVATSGFIKKTKKTPKKEIARAENIRKEYLKSIALCLLVVTRDFCKFVSKLFNYRKRIFFLLED